MQDYDRRVRAMAALVLVWSFVSVALLGAQTAAPATQAQAEAQAQVPDFRIGIGDELSVRVWREPEMSADVVVLPNGKITLPLINEIDAIGLTVAELREKVTVLLADGFHEDPVVSVVVKTINSRQVFITGMVNKPGPYPLLAPTSVIQLIAMAGGLADYADQEHITVVRANQRRPDGEPWSFEVNFKDIANRSRIQQNLVMLEPGDTVIVR